MYLNFYLRCDLGIYTENVATATMMTHFNRTYMMLLNDASHQSLSQIEVEIERFKSLTFDFGCKPVMYQKCYHGNHDE